MFMPEISESELKDIISSYGLADLSFDGAEQVEPDTMLYFFHDNRNIEYILIAADYLGGYSDIDLPYNFVFDYYKNHEIKFTALCRYSYIEGAPKAATGYIDDERHLTSASTGDVCILFGCYDVTRPKGSLIEESKNSIRMALNEIVEYFANKKNHKK